MLYGLFSTFSSTDGGQKELMTHLLNAAELLSNDPTCIQYIVGQSGEREVSVFEVWPDRAAHDASLKREDLGALINAARPLIAGMGQRIELDVAGGKGPE
jgi:quinol monooxygenase YgiN